MVENLQPKTKEIPAAARAIAKGVRFLTVPPLLIGGLLVYLYVAKAGMFSSLLSLFLSILFLAVIPSLAYLVAFLVPKFRAEGHKRQRSLAFVFSIIGYSGGVLYAVLDGVSRDLRVIFFTYFLSVVLLTICNKVLKFRASGHGCGVTGPLLLPAYYVSPILLLPCALVLGMVYLSSLLLKRHTARELFAGSGAALVSFLICVLLF